MKPCDTTSQVTTPKKKKIKYRGMIKSVTQHSYFEKKPNKLDRWVDFKTTHQLDGCNGF
jgi:hypothetical protein